MAGKILVTGGAGYIGSHTCLELLNAGFEVVVVDNLDNSVEESLHRVRSLTGREIAFHDLAAGSLWDERLDLEVDRHTLAENRFLINRNRHWWANVVL